MSPLASSTSDWSALDHARGPARDVPEILEGLRSADDDRCASARRNAWNKLYSDKTWYSAQAPFVGALFDLAADAAVGERHRLLSLAANILTQGTGDKIPRGLDLNKVAVAERYRDGVGAELRRVFVEQLPFLVGLLAHPEPALRAASVECLSFVPEAPPLTLDPLLAAIEREHDEAVLAVMLHGLGLMIRYSNRTALSAVLELRAASGPLVARACAITGMMSFDPTAYNASTRDFFVEVVALPDQPAERFPFKGGLLDQMLSECVFAAGGLAPMWDLQTAAIRRGRASETTVSRLANDLLSSALRRAALTTRDELTREQLAIVDELSQREIVARFTVRGLPMKRNVRRRWLELDAPGPLNWPVDFASEDGIQRCSIWKALMLAGDEVNARADLLRTHFSALERLEIYADQSLLDREPTFTDTLSQGFESNDYAVLLESINEAGISALTWATSTTDQLLRHPDAINRMNNASLVPIVRSLRQNEELDSHYDEAVNPTAPWWEADTAPLNLLREVLERIPQNRREAIFLRVAVSQQRGRLPLIRTFELCPTHRLTTAVLDTMNGRMDSENDARHHRDRACAMLEAMARAAQTHQEVASALRSYVPVSEFLKAELPGAVANLPA